MAGLKIAVTGVGGGVGQSIVKSLYSTDYSLVGLDGEHLAAGLFAVPKAYLIPYANSVGYIDRLLEVCRTENCKLLFPGLDAELRVLSEHRSDFLAIGTQVVVSNSDVVEISDNKEMTFAALSKMGVNVPQTCGVGDVLESKVNIEFPLIVKQKVGGARSKNVFVVRTKDELLRLTETKEFIFDNYVVQEFIEGDEFTCGTLYLNNKYWGAIVMRRILRDGDTHKCFSQRHPVIEQMLEKLITGIRPFGACNVQLRIKNGIPYVFEINARCSGTTAARSLCGFNEPKMIADFLLKGIEPNFQIQEKTILRYWNELEVDNTAIATLIDSGSSMNTGFTHL